MNWFQISIVADLTRSVIIIKHQILSLDYTQQGSNCTLSLKMAHWNGGSGTRDGVRILPTFNLQYIQSFNSEDTEEHVIDEAESVTLNFIYDASKRQLANEDVPNSISSSISEVFNFTPDTTRYIDYWEGQTLTRCICNLFVFRFLRMLHIRACTMYLYLYS